MTFVTGFNRPGYMPEAEPREFQTYEDACKDLIDELGTIIDECDDYHTCEAAAAAMTTAHKAMLSGSEAPIEIVVEGFAYFLHLT